MAGHASAGPRQGPGGVFAETPPGSQEVMKHTLSVPDRLQRSTLIVLLLVILPPAALAQEGGGELTGRVTDAWTGEPVATASVLLDGGRSRAVTGSSGRFRLSLPDSRPDSVRIEVRHLAYRTWSDVLPTSDLEAQGTLVIRLEPRTYQAPTLEAVVSRTERYLGDVGFYERMSEGGGYYLTPDSLETRRYGMAEQMLSTTPAILLRQASSDEDLIYVDGRPLRRLGIGVEDLLMDRIAAVEAYRCAEAPLEYRLEADDLTSCMVVLIWRRPPGATGR